MNNTTQKPEEEMPLSPDEIKAIGEIQLGPAKHEVFLNKHYKKLIIGGVALIVAATAGIAWYAYGEQQEEDASSTLIAACGITNESATPDALRYDVSELNRVKAEYPETGAARSADVFLMQNQMAAATPNLELCKKMADGSGADEYRLPACAHLAAYYMKNGDDANAIVYLRKIVETPSSNAYKNQSYKYLAFISLKQGNKEQAASYLSKMTNGSVDRAYVILKDMIEGGYEPTVVEPVAETPSSITEPVLPTQESGAADALPSLDSSDKLPSLPESSPVDTLTTPTLPPMPETSTLGTGDAPVSL